MGKTRDLFKKIRDTKGTFHAKMGSVKDTNGMDQTEAEDIKKRWPVQVQCTILDAWGWCTGTTQRDGMGREEGGGFRMGNNLHESNHRQDYQGTE